jgi:xylulokinase
MPATHAYLGLDLGTSSVKALAVDGSGQVLGVGSAEYPVHRPHPGHAEQDPDDWWEGTIAATRQALSDAAKPEIVAIGITGQMHGTVLLDADEQPLGRAIIWMDQRSEREVPEITGMVGRERLLELTGSPLATGFQAATLHWVRRREPSRWDNLRRILPPKDELRRRLTGVIATDPSDGSGTLLLDVQTRDWSETMLDATGISREHLPLVCPSHAVSGTLTANAAKAMGLSAGIPVITGAGDAPAAALGAGVASGERLLVTLSTGAQVLVPTRDIQIDREGRLHTFCAAIEPGHDGAAWYQMGAVLAGGLALHWLRDNVFALDGNDALSRMTTWADEAPPGASGLIMLPYLIGERTPHMDPIARGVIIGLTAAHGRGELVRATMEGVAFACLDAFTVLQGAGARPSRIIVAGGGSRSTLWLQIIADIFGMPVQPLLTADQSAIGAAMLAAIGTGASSFAAAISDWPVYGQVLEPHPATHRLYRELFPIFRSAYQHHREDFQTLSRITHGWPGTRPNTA